MITETTIGIFINSTLQDISNSDLKSICRARQFNPQLDRDQIETLYATTAGVAAALKLLSPEERDFLFYMIVKGKKGQMLALDDFASLYPARIKSGFGMTYATEYGGLLKEIKASFIKRGLLVMRELSSYRRKSKMERLAFAFPPSFYPIYLKSVGSHHPELLGSEVDQLLGNVLSAKNNKLLVKNGKIFFATGPLVPSTFRAYQKKKWATTVKIKKHQILAVNVICQLTDLVHEGKRGGNSWSSAAEIGRWAQSIDERLCEIQERAWEGICFAGYQVGSLRRLEKNSQTFYQSNDQFNGEDDFAQCFKEEGELVHCFTEDISLSTLEKLNSFSTFIVKDENSLFVTPDFFSIAKNMAQIKDDLLLKKFCQKFHFYKRVVSEVKRKFGKTTIHSNISVFRIKDLALLVTIQKQLKQQCLKLSNEYLAIPRALLPKVNKIVTKAGFATKFFSGEAVGK